MPHADRKVITVVQRVCGAAMALFFLCFLLSGSGGGVQPRGGREASPVKRRLISGGGQDDGSPWHLFGGAPQRPAAPPVKTLTWEEARTWVRERLEALAAADSERGWRGVADPLAAFREQQSPLDGDPASRRRRRQMLNSDRAPGRDVRQGWDSRRADRRRTLADEGTAAAAGDQGIDPDSLDVPADDPDEGDDESGTERAAPAHRPTALVVVPTANVWNMTAAMIRTLELCRDRFELLIIDERSTDETPERLWRTRIRVMQPDGTWGVTHNWNMAYKYWLQGDHPFLFLVNNDVLVPSGVLTKLMDGMRDDGPGCDLISPLSTARGKGYRGDEEGIEPIYQLEAGSSMTSWVTRPHNYARMQALLDEVPATQDNLIIDTADLHNASFSGFFFGMRRNIVRAAYHAKRYRLWDPHNRILGQEPDLWKRMVRLDPPLTTCLHRGTFVFHHKGSTVGDNIESADRAKFHAPGR